jgi:hypothetical protein
LRARRRRLGRALFTNACWVGSGPSDPLRHVRSSAMPAPGDWRKWRSRRSRRNFSTYYNRISQRAHRAAVTLNVAQSRRESMQTVRRESVLRTRACTNCGVQSGRLPPWSRFALRRLLPLAGKCAEGNRCPLLSFESPGGATLETFNLYNAQRGWSGRRLCRRIVESCGFGRLQGFLRTDGTITPFRCGVREESARSSPTVRDIAGRPIRQEMYR